MAIKITVVGIYITFVDIYINITILKETTLEMSSKGTEPTSVMGKTLSKIWYFLISLIAHLHEFAVLLSLESLELHLQ